MYRNAASESLAFLQGDFRLLRKWWGVLYADYFDYLKLQKWKRRALMSLSLWYWFWWSAQLKIKQISYRSKDRNCRFNSIQFNSILFRKPNQCCKRFLHTHTHTILLDRRAFPSKFVFLSIVFASFFVFSMRSGLHCLYKLLSFSFRIGRRAFVEIIKYKR